MLPIRSLRFAVRTVSGQSGVPVLVDPDHGIEEMAGSDDIIANLEELYG